MKRSMKTMDGNHAAAHASYAFTDVAAIYPITPSSVMAEATDEWATAGRKNIFGQTVQVTEMQSEAGAAGTVHGSLAAGALTTTYTASQGLLLMIPNMYKIAGEQMPCVFDVSARALASHALNIFGDHSDVYACRQTGFAMLCSSSVQEVMDLGAVAHLATIKGRVPVLHFFDGFRTSHEIQKIEMWDYDDLADMVDYEAIDKFRAECLNPEHPVLRGSAQNPDIFFQAREAANSTYNAFPAIVEDYMNQVNAKIGTDYKLFNYYGAEDAESVIIAMGSVCETIDETIDYLMKQGKKVGVVKVRLYRPFVAEKLVEAIPDTAKVINVLDRSKEPGAREPLYLDVVNALRGTKFESCTINGGRYGLGSKDTTPADIIATFENVDKNEFTLSIVDDVTNLSLERGETPVTAPDSIVACKFWGLGADGTVGANKNSIKIIGDHTDKYAQAYFDYDSKKSGGVTMSHLRFGDDPIKSTYLINKADFVACHCAPYLTKYNMVQDLKDGGTFLLNCSWTPEEVGEHLPGQVKAYLAKHNIKFYIIDGIKIGKEIGLGGRINTVLQSAFFKLSGIIPEEDAIKYMKDAATASYSKKGEAIVKMNHDAIDAGAKAIVEVPVPAEWADAETESLFVEAKGDNKPLVDYINNVQNYVNGQEGNALKVSDLVPYVDGHMPLGASAFEKRGVAVDVPSWNPDNCIQCNFCAYVCPHATIRPVAMTEEEAKAAPAATKTADMTGMPGYKFAMTVTVLDCLGCGSCVNICPGKKGEKALTMQGLDSQRDQQEVYDYGQKLPAKEEVLAKFKADSVKGSQFRQPMLEFSGACAGCGETPYAKLITQLFGERMYIANATGCSSIWGGSAPATPYTTNAKGQGPAWANSLFEDFCEFGLGMELANEKMRDRIVKLFNQILEGDNAPAEAKEVLKAWIENMYDADKTKELAPQIEAIIEQGIAAGCPVSKELKGLTQYLVKRSQWIIGGDGASYDIGYGGLDHVIASGKDVNILVLDTEVYSNTGGQSSKATPVGAIAKFAAAGKRVRKKDLGLMATTYGYVYVAQIAMGADQAQTLKAIREAEAYPGPSLIIAYAPCINHGLKAGMGKSQAEEAKAVECGYWHLWRFNPALEEEGKNPFMLDSKEPKWEGFQDFLKNEVRFASVMKQYPAEAADLFAACEEMAKKRYASYKRMEAMNWGE